MTEQWVEEKDWSKVKPEQRVRLEHENGDVVEVEVRVPDDAGGFASAFNFYSVSAGWTLYVTPPPTPELPTEPGFYLGTDELNSNPQFIMLIAEDGSRYAIQASAHAGVLALSDAQRFAPFTRLAPVPDTARQVLDLFREKWGGCDGGVSGALAEIAAEFGVVAERGTE